MRFLTRSRSASFHRSTMLNIIAASSIAILLWQPLTPVRNVTGTILHTAADLVSR